MVRKHEEELRREHARGFDAGREFQRNLQRTDAVQSVLHAGYMTLLVVAALGGFIFAVAGAALFIVMGTDAPEVVAFAPIAFLLFGLGATLLWFEVTYDY